MNALFSFTPAEVEILKMESAFFARWYAESITMFSLKYWRNQIATRFPAFKNSQKIAAIKWIREETRGKNLILDFFIEAGYTCMEQSWLNGEMVLDLRGAKEFVESVS